MEKSKTSGGQGQDRLSKLPNSIIFHIFSLMAMTDVVKTSILSRRWRNLWTTVPTLNFNGFKMETDDVNLFLNRVRNFINRALILWRGGRIEEFVIDLGTRFNESIYSDIDVWLLFATKHRVQTLSVHLKEDYSIHEYREFYLAPQCLYSCSSLQYLYLQGCKFHVPTKNVNWVRLEYLKFRCCELSKDLITKVLSGSPALDDLSLLFVENNDSLIIESTSLRYLCINKYLRHETDDLCVGTELRILTPNLEYLDLSGVPYSEFVMSSVPYLYGANISFSAPNYYDPNFVGQTLRQILPHFKYVQSVTLSDWDIKTLGVMNNKNMLSSFPNVKKLELHGRFEQYEQIVRLLEIFPKLDKLVLVQEEGRKAQQHGCTESVTFIEAKLPNCIMQSLRTIVIIWAEGEDSLLPFIEFLLKYTSKLEKMVFLIEETTAPSKSLLMTLLRMPKSSPTAELIFSSLHSGTARPSAARLPGARYG